MRDQDPIVNTATLVKIEETWLLQNNPYFSLSGLTRDEVNTKMLTDKTEAKQRVEPLQLSKEPRVLKLYKDITNIFQDQDPGRDQGDAPPPPGVRKV